MRMSRLLLCASLLGASLALPACNRQQQSDPVLERVLANIRSMNGRRFEGGITVSGGRIEGRTLIVVVDVPAEARQAFTPAQFTALLARGICAAQGGSSFFAEGRSIRLDAANAGPGWTGASIDHCPTPAETGLDAAGGLSTATFARGMQQLVGRQMGPLTIASVAAEGNVLVVTLDGQAGWRGDTSSSGINAAFLSGYCRNPDAAIYFSAGRTMRVDTMENGQNRIQGQPIDRCPAAP